MISSRAAHPGDDAIAVSTSPAVQTPNASSPRSAPRRTRRAARPGRRRVERGGRRVVAVVRPRRPGRGRPGYSPPPAAPPRRPPRAASARAATSRRPSSERSFVSALPVWPSWTERIGTDVSSTASPASGASARSATERALVGDVACASPPSCARARARRATRRARRGAHATPTWTSRNRAGAAPCETA